MSDRRDEGHLLQYLVESVTDHAIYMLDLEGRVVTWNRGAQRLKGYSRDEILHQSFSRFFTLQDQRAGLPARLLKTAASQERVESIGWRVRKDGERFWARAILHAVRDEGGQLIGFAKVTRDLTAEREAEEALRESERRFRLLVEGVVDYAIYMLDPQGVITDWNRGAERMKGYGADEVIGRHFSLFYLPEEVEAGLPKQALSAALADGRYENEGWRVRKDGGLFWASVVIDAIHDQKGELVGFAKITRDITERRQAQFDLQRAQEQVAQAQKMEALGQLTGGVAHDFNNLLMVVSGQAQLLRRKLADDPRTLKALDAIEMSAHRGQELTRHLLTFSRRQRLQPVTVSLEERMGCLQELLVASLSKTIELSVDLPEGLWHVEVDPSELELSLLNLAVNARDAMPDGGAFSITAENLTLEGDEAVHGLTGEFVAISLADTGQGIPPDILPRVFEPFFTTKEVNKGTGLGLSQVYGFVEQSGGKVLVDSELGKGTRFTLLLPRARADAATAGEGPAWAEAASAAILLVEDNPEVAEVAAAMLEQLGHRVQVAGSATAALEALRDGAMPDLVFSDIVMAGDLDGLGFARILRNEAPGLPILLATGYSQAAERLGDEFPILRKPYKLGELNRAVGSLLTKARLEQAAAVPGAETHGARTVAGQD